MDEEIGKHEGDSTEVENTEEVTYTCNSCGREDTVGYFYCEKCHIVQKRKGNENSGKKEVI